jgi:nitronate monooxygenase
MSALHLARSRACALLSCRLPVVLAGMGGVSRSELVAAVSSAGGFGFLGMVREPAALIEREVAAVRARGHDAFGVNIIPAATDSVLLEKQLGTIIELGVPAVCLFWDIDARVIARLRDAGITVVYQVGSVAEAAAAERAGADLIIAQGVEAGGHVRGTRPLRALLPDVLDAVQVPVLAAGGLATGSDLVAAMALGADGIVLGTALMATDESVAHSFHKQRLIEAGGADTVLTETFHINWPPGAPVRVLKSAVTERQAPAGGTPSARTVIGDEDGRPIYLFSTDSPLRSMTGDFAAMALYAGTGVGNLGRIEPAKTRIERIVADANAILAAAAPDPIAESSSAVCYLGEFSGAYMGTLDIAEINGELKLLGSQVQALLAAQTPTDRWDVLPDAAYAPWVPTLRQQLGEWLPTARGAASAATILDELTRLLPKMPEGATRQSLLKLRSVLEQNLASARPAALSV